MVEDTIKEKQNAAGTTVQAYYCELVVANNELQDLVVPYYYDLIFPCAEGPDEGRNDVEAALLYRSKESFLPNNDACTNPRNPWFAQVSSLPQDKLAGFDCQKLAGDAAADTCCLAIAGEMTFTQSSTAVAATMKTWVMKQLNDPKGIAPGYTVKYIGSELPPDFVDNNSGGQDSDRGSTGDTPPASPPDVLLPAGIAGNQDVPQPPTQEDTQFTMTGILILIGMGMIFVAIITLILKHRRRYKRGQDVDAAIAQSELHMYNYDKEEQLAGEHIETATWGDGTFDEQDLEVQIHDNDPQITVRSVSNVSYQTREGQAAQNSIAREPHLNQQYRFDLADSHRNNVMGAYGADLFGPTQITVVPPYPMEETSESEVDSWAQTDGEVGSLDDDHHLVADTETGEI